MTQRLYKHIGKLLLISASIFILSCSTSNISNSDLVIASKIPISSNTITIKDSIEDRKHSPIEEVYEFVDQMPQYPGGETEMMKFFAENFKIAQEHLESGLQGRVILQFIVTETGQIKDIKAIRTPDSLFSKAHIDVVKLMPKWNPGKHDGKAVAVRYTLPMQIHLK